MSAFIMLGLQLLPQLLQAGEDIAGIISLMKRVAASDGPSAADWTAIHAIEDYLRDKLHSDDR